MELGERNQQLNEKKAELEAKKAELGEKTQQLNEKKAELEVITQRLEDQKTELCLLYTSHPLMTPNGEM